jgi:gamma-tubulin complex component 3
VLKNGQSPDTAVRFSHLLSRLLTQPVLSRKAEILELFDSLSDLEANDAVESPPRARGASQGRIYKDAGSAAGDRRPDSRGRLGASGSSQESAKDAFRIRNLPSRPGRQRVASGSSGDQKNGKTRGSKGLTKSSVLADNYPELDPPETALLRDLPFTLQGVSSTNMVFSKGSSLTLPSTLPIPIISILHTLAEPSLLCQGLSAFVQSAETGLIGQSLQSAIGRELQSYLGLVATLEGEIRRALAMLDKDEPRSGIGKAGVTLKRCVVWTREATMGLRLMSLMVEESKSI